MRVLFLIQGYEHPASRYRVLQYLEPLRAAGVEDRVAVFPGSRAEWRALEGEFARCDIVFVQKKRLRKRQADFMRRCGAARIVFDVDDAVMFKSSRASSHRSWTRMRAFARMCRLADFAIAGNAYIEGMIREYNDETAVIPTAINTDLYPEKADYGGETVTLGWIGGKKSLVFIEELAPVFEDVCARYPQAQLKLVCNAFFDLPNMPVIEKQWAEAEEGADVMSFDVGLAPLPDDPWARGKCATKLLQCMASGVPCVASAVGVHNEIVQEGVNGYLARTHEEWRAHLLRLCGDAELRARLGRKCRETVEGEYSLRSSVPKMLAAFERAITI